MRQADFVAQLESALRQTGRPFNRGQLTEFVSDYWPVIPVGPWPEFWAVAFLESQAEHAGESTNGGEHATGIEHAPPG